jgi:hypothetical protein
MPKNRCAPRVYGVMVGICGRIKREVHHRAGLEVPVVARRVEPIVFTGLRCKAQSIRSGVQNVRMVCNESGHCWRERGERRVIIREHHDGQAQPKTNYDSPRYSADSHYI